MTLNEWVVNPQGKSNAVLNATAREAIRTTYTHKFNAIVVREHGVINYKLYYDSKNNRYVAYIKIPSEAIGKFYYDVVLEFTATEDVEGAGKNLLDYNVRFYSNDPAFVYTHAFVYNQNGLFFSDLRSKMSRKAIRQNPTVSNPGEQVGYVKTLYFAYLFLKGKGFTNVTKFKGESEKLNMSYLLSQIENADNKIEDRQAEAARISKAKNPFRKRKQTTSDNMNVSANSINTTKITKTKTTNRIKSTIKNVATTKRK